VLIERGAIERSVPVLQRELPPGTWLLVSDEHTHAAAGRRLIEALNAAGQSWSLWQPALPEKAGAAVGGEPVCNEASVAACRDAIDERGAAAVIGIGAGTINDIAKFGAHKAGVRAACVATAPSMNGYTSAIAAVLTDGVKTTQPCTPTKVVIADVEVLSQAPAALIQSGIGDLASKPVSNADWIISARLTGSTHSEDAAAIIEASSSLLEGVAPELASRDPEAVERLTAALILSGFAMAVAGNSAPASGGEHLVSHYLDMVAIAAGEEHDLHGRQVGVGTLTAAFLYEKLLELSPEDIDPEARAAALRPWDEHARLIEQRFGSLAATVLPHAEAGYPSPDLLRRRLSLLRQEWPSLMDKLSRTLRPSADIQAELAAAGAPVRFKDLGVGRDRAYRSISHSRDIRSRYTILDLVWELGYLDQWADEAVARFFE
jgi:glycerol-1-phosphate dehydrogenase [NAD(P)+]